MRLIVVQQGKIKDASILALRAEFLKRFQLHHIAYALEGPAVIMGDFNAVGPIRVPEFRDVGPRKRTHKASNIVSLRLDRCIVRDVRCLDAEVLDRGPSDHHPILMELSVTPAVVPARVSQL